MRRILNLNQPGIVFVKIIGLFIVVIPVLLYCTVYCGNQKVKESDKTCWVCGRELEQVNNIRV